MKRLLSIILTAAVLCGIFCLPSDAAYDSAMEGETFYSDCLLLVSADNGEVIFEKNARKQTPPASLTKVITSIVVLENCEDLNTTVTVSESNIRELDGTGSSLGGLKAGEQLSVYDLLCCMLMQSANEAATTLADFISNGDREKFVSMMNEVAEKLGCTNSHFVNPHGLDDENQYVTAEDMAKFLTRAMEFPAFSEIVARLSYTLPKTNLQEERIIRTTNNMLNSAYKDYYCKYVKGGKTGSTSVAGRCVVEFASKDGYNYIGVALNSVFEDIDKDGVEENGSFIDCKTMFEWAFENIELVAISDTNQIVAQVPIKYAKSTDYLTLSPQETVYSLVPVGTDSGSLLVEPIEGTVPESVKAPVKKGDVICKGRVLYAGETIKEINLVASRDVQRNFFSFLGSIAKSLLSSWLFKIVALAVIVVLIVLLFMRRKKEKTRPIENRDYRVLNYSDFIKLKK